jgi:uncharacterized phage infection (PIP) family protein YhgE
MEGELAAQHEEAAQVVAAYEKRVQEVEAESLKLSEWAKANEARLNSQMEEIVAHSRKLDGDLKKAGENLAEYQKKLDEAEALVIERTLWAQNEQKQREEAEGKVAAVEASRWLRMGKAFGLGPKIS